MLRISHMTLLLVLVISAPGCQPDTNEEPTNRYVKRTKVAVNPKVLNDYVGNYRLPSGVLFQVRREQGRLMAGEPPSELLPQTTRKFASNRIIAEIIFDKDEDGPAQRVNIRAARRDMWAKRVESTRAEDPTQMVATSEGRLRMLVKGTGFPTIVVEDGFGSSIMMRSQLQAELSKFTRVVTYDHAGTGGSEAGAEPRHADRIAVELRSALRNASIDPPYVMVGGSIGADYISVFTGKYPDDVAGIVRLDPTPDWEAMDEWMKVNAPSRVESHRKMIASGLSSIPDFMKLQEAGRQAEWAALEQTEEQARRSLPLPEIPIVQITGAAGYQTIQGVSDKVKFFDTWLKENIPHAKHVLAQKSGHAVFAAQPKLVVREIKNLVTDIRQGTDAPSD